MGESRQELLSWLNSLLQLNITKVEQCGTGSALCQIYDSIFMDVPMSRVKFNVNSEYAYIQNFKILQSAFTRHEIDHPVPVEALIKCKMQDNLEFLQFTKRYWDTYFPGHDYDALARRQASGPVSNGPVARSPARTSTARTTSAPRRPAPVVSNTTAVRTTAPMRTTSSTSSRNPTSTLNSNAAAAALSQNAELKEQIVGLERERDFYFSKLREIEVMLQTEVETRPELEEGLSGGKEAQLVARVQGILYSTEEGFEIPGEGEEGVGGEEEMGGDGHGHIGAGEEETF